MLNDNNVAAIDGRSVFQFYPMVNLWHDLQLALRAQLGCVHLTAQPVSVAEIAVGGFGRTLSDVQAGTPASYDLRSKHAGSFGGAAHYQYSKRETLLAVRAYAQSEAPSKADKGAA
jgi:hypothetical protein